MTTFTPTLCAGTRPRLNRIERLAVGAGAALERWARRRAHARVQREALRTVVVAEREQSIAHYGQWSQIR